MQRSRHNLRFHFPLLSFASGGTFHFSLEDIIQELRDTSWVYFKDEREVIVEE